MKAKRLLVFNDQLQDWPVWEEVHEPADPAELPNLSDELGLDLRGWAEQFQSNFSFESDWNPQFDHEHYLRLGRELADRLQAELGESFVVEYIECSQSERPPVFRTEIDGQQWAVRHRPYDPGVYDFDWLNHLVGYGFTTGLHPRTARLTTDEIEKHIRDFLADIDPATGFTYD